MRRVIVVVTDSNAEFLTDLLAANGFKYETELAHASDDAEGDIPYENLAGFTAEDIRNDAEIFGVKLSVMNCHRVLDAMDEVDYDSNNFEEIIRRIASEHPSIG